MIFRSLRVLLIPFLLVLSSCKKPVDPSPSVPPAEVPPPAPATQNTSPKPANPEFIAAYEKAQTRAVQEFPDVGIAGSALNTEFLARVKVMQAQNSEELKQPTWPYTLAKTIHAELTAKTRSPAPAAAATQPAPNSNPSQNYTIEELKTLAVLPSAGTVRGVATQIDIGIGDPLEAVIVLDGVLTCEVNLKASYTGNGTMRLVRQGTSIQAVTKWRPEAGSKERTDTISYNVGQSFTVEGQFLKKPNGKFVLKGKLVK